MYLENDDQIIACSSGTHSNSAISIIRLSGFENLNFLKDCISISTYEIKTRFAHYCSLKDLDKKLDDIILTYFKAPNSYNGENILELSVHGNLLNVERIIDFFVHKKSFRRAYPGEFSYRALRNKKLNLSQVEGLDLLLNANSFYALEQGNSLLSGELKESYLNLYKSFLNHKSAVEMSIDFLEDMGEEQANENFSKSLNILKENIDSLVNRCRSNTKNILKPDICLLGKPNSGKSSLFNSLLRSDRAIVSDLEGTTRDFIKEDINIDNVIFSLIDTAGIRKSNDEIEMIGVTKALKVFEDAFFKVVLINPKNYEKATISNNKFDLIIITHKDSNNKLDSFLEDLSGSMGAVKSGSIEPKVLFLDTRNLTNEDNLFIKSAIIEKFNVALQNKPITISRHKDLILSINDLLLKYQKLLTEIDDISIISSELNIIGHCVSELVGIIKPEEVLNNIFDNFCIGK